MAYKELQDIVKSDPYTSSSEESDDDEELPEEAASASSSDDSSSDSCQVAAATDAEVDKLGDPGTTEFVE